VITKPSQPTSISPSTNLVDFDKKTDSIRLCIVCNKYFEDISYTSVCSDCNHLKNPSAQRYVTVRRAPANPTYSNSDFLTPHSSSSKIRGPLKIICSNCNRLNMINHIQPGMDYTCSICSRSLRIPNY
jgi:hypothetical protein